MVYEWFICETNRLKAKSALGTLKKFAVDDEAIKVPRPQQGAALGGKFFVFIKTRENSTLKIESLKFLPKLRSVTKDEFEAEVNKFKYFW